jgi:hypothetical protein
MGRSIPLMGQILKNAPNRFLTFFPKNIGHFFHKFFKFFLKIPLFLSNFLLISIIFGLKMGQACAAVRRHCKTITSTGTYFEPCDESVTVKSLEAGTQSKTAEGQQRDSPA